MGRSRLDARLTAAAGNRLTLVVAGAGYGKTTLLRGWPAPLPVAWHTIGPADRVPGILARHIVDALRLRVPDLSADLMVAASRLRGHDGDEIGQALTGLNLVLEVGSQISGAALRARLGEAQTLVNELTTRVRQLSCAQLIAETITRISNEESVSSLFID